MPQPTDNLDQVELDRLAEALRALTRDQIRRVLEAVPTSWPPTDVDLEALGFFLEVRKNDVATRLEAL